MSETREDYKKSFGAAIHIITGLLEPIVSVKEDEVLQDVLNKNLEDMCSDIMDEGPRMISDAFLDWFFDAFPYLYYGLLQEPEKTSDLPKILYGIAYNYYKETAEYSVKIVEQFDREPYSIDFHVFSEECYSRFCGRLMERMKVLDPVSDSVDDLCSRMMPSQRYMIGFVFCSFSAMLCALMHNEELKGLIDDLVVFMRSVVASHAIPMTVFANAAEEQGISMQEAVDMLAEQEVWMTW